MASGGCGGGGGGGTSTGGGNGDGVELLRFVSDLLNTGDELRLVFLESFLADEDSCFLLESSPSSSNSSSL